MASPIPYFTTLPCLDVSFVEVQILCKVFILLHDQVMKCSCDLLGGIPPPYITTLPSLVATGIMEVQI